uniref:Uncharacterized protein n=1 Tax=Arion vulgaris TaxID=1028688 RepID=A0A0B7AFY2_9EUPU
MLIKYIFCITVRNPRKDYSSSIPCILQHQWTIMKPVTLTEMCNLRNTDLSTANTYSSLL